MTADIVERLREYAEDDHERLCQGRCYSCSCGYDDRRDPLITEAATEIERLRAEKAKLRRTLAEIAEGEITDHPLETRAIARAALGEKP